MSVWNGKKKAVEVLVHLSVRENELHAAWHFPDCPNAPVDVSVPLATAQDWVAQPNRLGLRNGGCLMGNRGLRNIALAQPAPTQADQGLRKLGDEIYRELFEPVRERWNKALVAKADEPVRLIFQWDSTLCERGLDPALIPFETLRYAGEGAGAVVRVQQEFVLAKGVSLERRVTSQNVAPATVPPRGGHRILVFTAPIQLNDDKRTKEKRESELVRNCIRKAARFRRVRVTVYASSPDRRAMWEAFCDKVNEGADVVHFIGHGQISQGQGELMFERKDGKEDWRSISDVAQVLGNAGVKLVILNCCETVSFSSFACYFPAVIGHQFAVTGDSVERFEQTFFRELFKAGCVEKAVWEGRQAIFAEERATSWEYRAPVLFLQSGGGRHPPARRNALWWTLLIAAALAVAAHGAALVLQSRGLARIGDLARPEALFDSRDYARAFHAYCRASDAALRDLALHRRIEECARRGNLKTQFLNRYLVLVRNHPQNAVFRNYLGNAYLLIDPNDAEGKAREQYEEALRLDPNFSPPLANLGILAMRKGDQREAERLTREYLAKNPDDAVAWANLGLIYAARVEADAKDGGAAQAAMEALKKALEIDPALAKAHKGLGRVYAAAGRKKEALQAFQRSLALDYEQPDVRQQVELLAWDLGATRLPGSIAGELTPRSPGHEKSLATEIPAAVLGMQLLEKREFGLAAAVCEEWTRREAENPLAWELLGRAHAGQGQQDKAQAAFQEVERLMGGRGDEIGGEP